MAIAEGLLIWVRPRIYRWDAKGVEKVL